MKAHAKQRPAYLSFTRKERAGIIGVLFLMMIYPCIPFIAAFLSDPKPADYRSFEKELASLKIKQDDYGSKPAYYNNTGYTQDDYANKNKYYNGSFKGQLFYFDPNSASIEDWIKLGVRHKTANTIHKYLAKGGRFYKPDDISKIWGLHEDEVSRLLPYVIINEDKTPVNNKYAAANERGSYENRAYPTTKTVDVNNSDTAAFIALPGIGSKLAARIVAFREKLGGFYQTEQIAETYGLPDSTFQKIRNRLVIGNSSIKKININKATVDELKAHPYLRYHIANAIVQYRTQHGNFSSVEEIKSIVPVTGDLYNKAAPYLTIK